MSVNETEKTKQEPPDESKSSRGRIVADPELLTIAKIMAALNELATEESRVRVVRYLASRLDFPLVDGGK